MPWLDAILSQKVRFVLRWPRRYKLVGPRTGGQPRKAWELVRGQRSWEHRLLWCICRRPNWSMRCGVQAKQMRTGWATAYVLKVVASM